MKIKRKTMGGKWKAFRKELKKVGYIAAPMVAVTVMQYLLQVIAVMMVGHLGDEILLSGVSIATSFTSVTGFSFLVGMAGALETLCGKAYGAEEFQKLGIYTYCSIICLTLVCFPISVLWLFSDKLLKAIGQDPSISRVAHKYSLFLIPNLYSNAVLQSLIRYFQTQSLILPMLYTSFATLCLHIPICWAFMFRVKLGFIGAAIAISLSTWLNVILLACHMRYSSVCKRTRCTFSKNVFRSTKTFIRLAIPSSMMVCLEWWSYEVLILLCGLLPNPKLETSVLTVCFAITYLHYYIPYAFGATASTRVSNELGAGNQESAKMVVWAVMSLAAAEIAIVNTILFCCRHILGYAFSSENEIVNHVADMAPLICLSIIVDSLQAVLSGVARGSGWQYIGAYVNLGAYYLVGIPVGAVLGFAVHLMGKGLWIGLVTGSAVQAAMLALITCLTNWHKQDSTVNSSL